MKNVALDVIKPEISDVFRVVFLFVGQGESTILAIPTKDSGHKYALIDSNIDTTVDGVDLIEMLEDLLGSKSLDYYINTHPHNDHNAKIKEINDRFGIKEIWHSGHIPKGKHKDSFEEMKEVIKKIGKENEFLLKGTNSENKIRKASNEEDVIRNLGQISYQVFAPAEYVKDEIEDEDSDTHYRRIHEHCAVIKFTYGNPRKSILITGDSDCVAWKEHITDNHKVNLKTNVLSASHHGSRDFFWKNGNMDTEVYTEHLEAIDPEYLVISAPDDSPHDHPHEEALKEYKKVVDEEKMYYLGEGGFCLVVDIYLDGTLKVRKDYTLVEEYCSNEDKSSEKFKSTFIKSKEKTKVEEPERFA